MIEKKQRRVNFIKQSNNMKNSTMFLFLSILVFIVWYSFLKYSFNISSNNTFLQEFILIVLWTIVTIFITAALLNKQSEIELEKEQNVKIFDLKSETYFKLIDLIEEIFMKHNIDNKDITKLEFLSHKISTLADYEVLKEYNNFLTVIKKTIQDGKISLKEEDEISLALSKLCFNIRKDLLEQKDNKNKKIKSIIEENIEII